MFSSLPFLLSLSTQAVEDDIMRKKRKREKKATKRAQATLSFGEVDEEEGEEEGAAAATAGGETSSSSLQVPVVKKVMKNPNAVTNFLPDKDREAEAARVREQLKVSAYLNRQ
jgi:protein FAM50